MAASIAHRAVIEQRAIAMLGDDGNASLSEIFARAGVPPIGIRDALTRESGSEALAAVWRLLGARGLGVTAFGADGG